MNQLFMICALLPFGVKAQLFQMKVSECLPNKFIQIKTQPPGQAIKIYRKAKGELGFKHIGNTNPEDGLLHDRSSVAKSGQVCSYRFQLPNGQWSNEIQGYVCLTGSAMAIVPYQPMDRTQQNIDFQWSALQNVQKYQLQVARKEQNESLVNGFAPENRLLDTILSTNRFNWQSNTKQGDTLYWSVKPVLEPAGGTAFFIHPIPIVITSERHFSTPPYSLNLTALVIQPENITIKIRNSGDNSLKAVKLHYFVSDTNVFTLQARLLTTQWVETIAPNKSIQIQQSLRLNGLNNKYLWVVPSVNGTFLEKQAVVQPIQ